MCIIYERTTIATNDLGDSAWSKLSELALNLKWRLTSRRRQLEVADLFYARVAARLAHFAAHLDGDSLRMLRNETTGRPGMQRWIRKTIEQIVDDTPSDARDNSMLRDAGRWEAVAAAAGWGELSGEVARIIANMLGE